jgi:hypothetical protein
MNIFSRENCYLSHSRDQLTGPKTCFCSASFPIPLPAPQFSLQSREGFLLPHVILMVPSLRPKLPTLPLESRLQLNDIGSQATASRPRWPRSRQQIRFPQVRFVPCYFLPLHPRRRDRACLARSRLVLLRQVPLCVTILDSCVRAIWASIRCEAEEGMACAVGQL